MRNAIFLTALLVLATGGVLSAQTTVAEISEIRIDEFQTVGFTLTKGAEIDIEGVGIRTSRSRDWAAYAWIIDSKSREMVWEMKRRGKARDRRDRSLREIDDVQFLEAGSYELYYSSYVPRYWNWDGDNFFDALGNLFDDDDDEYRRIRRESLDECYVELTSTELDNGDVKQFEPDGSLGDALIRKNQLGDSEYEAIGFKLSKPQAVRIYAILEFPRSNKSPVDYAWIVNVENRDRVWEMDRWDVDHAGGGEKNAKFDDEVKLDAGSYALYITTDDSHSFEEFNVNPPYDPLNWGVTILPGKDFESGAFELVDLPQLGKAAVDLTRIRDNAFKEQSFVLDRTTDLNIYAFGEATGREFVDFGGIIDTKTGETVWEMTKRNTDHGGGAEKNRVFDDVITLEAGTYTAFYTSDGSHSYRDWNSSPPYDPDHYGLSIFLVGDASADRIKLVSEDELNEQGHFLARITRVGNNARKRDRFELEEDTFVHIYALGEGRGGDMYDFAYIVDLNTGRDVWEMRYRRTDHAGGADKNRVFDDEIKLKAGEYEVVYESDGSHSFKRWNSTPPRDIINWGVTISTVD